jgi:hypothetical protein
MFLLLQLSGPLAPPSQAAPAEASASAENQKQMDSI